MMGFEDEAPTAPLLLLILWQWMQGDCERAASAPGTNRRPFMNNRVQDPGDPARTGGRGGPARKFSHTSMAQMVNAKLSSG